MVYKTSVKLATEGSAPAHVALTEDADFRATEGGSPKGPVAVVVMTVATAPCKGAMGGHHGEVFCAVVVPEEFEGESNPGVFSITIV